ncbi:MAG: hypothetical protein AAGF59_01295 [Pseudomonadota bacterium]
MKSGIRLFSAAIVSAGVATQAVADDHSAKPADALIGIEGQAIVSIHDGDMLASAYINGQLGPRESEDILSVLSLTNFGFASVPVSNSVAGAPTAVAVTPDGNYAVVSESFGPRPDDGERFSDLPIGTLLTLIDISDHANPTVVDTVETGRRLDGLSLSPDGSMIAVALHQTDGRGMAFVELNGAEFGAVSHASLPAIADTQRISHVEWHPSQDFLAIHAVDQSVIHFARINREGGAVALEAWGNPVRTSKYPFMGRFTPDGSHYLTGNLYWGPDVPGIWAEAVDGDVMSIRFVSEASGDTPPRHQIVGRAMTGVSPEGIAISPDGEWAVSTNLEVSYAPADDTRYTPYSSLTLIDIDTETGNLTTVGTYYYDGILPEAATFDASGRYVAVVNYDQHVGGSTGGSIDFWRLVAGDSPKLVKTRTSIQVPHGPHSMALVN